MGGGVLVVPGTFNVKMQIRQDGVVTDLGEPRSFEVVSVRPRSGIAGKHPGTTCPSSKHRLPSCLVPAEGTAASIVDVIKELDAVKETLERSLTDGSLYELANSIQQNLKIQKDRLAGNQKRMEYKDEAEMTVAARLWHAGFVFSSGAYGPTPEQRESLRIGRALYDDIVSELDSLVNVDYAGLKEAMDTARVPWTPGRGIQP